jgi:hypothetical protein
MNIFFIIIQIIIALGIYNVWIIRAGKKTQWRGENAYSIKEEFKAYKLPLWFMYCIGGTKIILATALIFGIWFPFLVLPASSLLTLLMIGAMLMHIKVRDPFYKSLPSFLMLLLNLMLVLFI